MQFQILSSHLSYRPASKTLAFPRKLLNSYNRFSVHNPSCNFNGFSLVGAFRRNVNGGVMKRRGIVCSSAEEGNSSSDMSRKRKVIEHICLLKGKEDLSEEQEQNMLDFLYTTQYQMRGIIAISLGRISGRNSENYTHGVFMRFQRKEDLALFYENHFYAGVLKDHVMPHCHGITSVDFESEVEDDILPIFRKGEEFNFGLEHFLLIGFVESSLSGPAEDALHALDKLTMEFPSLIVQSTKGSNFNRHSAEYTHVVVIRFRSSEAFEIFINSSEYKEMWRSKFQPIIRKALSISYSVDPVGTELM